MLTSPPLILSFLALIYLLHAIPLLWRIHSAQESFRRTPALLRLQYFSDGYAGNNRLFRTVYVRSCCILWIMTCCGFEFMLGNHINTPYLDHCVMFAGCAAAVPLYFFLSACLPPFCTAAKEPERSGGLNILTFGMAFGCEWKVAIGVGILLACRSVLWEQDDA